MTPACPALPHLALLLWSVDLARPDLAAAPFVYAATAAALDARVEIHFAGRAVRLLVAGEAARCRLAGSNPATARSLYDWMQEAARGGARFLACSMAWAAEVGADEAAIPEMSGQAGATAFMARTLDPAWRTLVF